MAGLYTSIFTFHCQNCLFIQKIIWLTHLSRTKNNNKCNMLLKRGRTIQFHICMDFLFLWNSITLVGIPRNLTLHNVTLVTKSLSISIYSKWNKVVALDIEFLRGINVKRVSFKSYQLIKFISKWCWDSKLILTWHQRNNQEKTSINIICACYYVLTIFGKKLLLKDEL